LRIVIARTVQVFKADTEGKGNVCEGIS